MIRFALALAFAAVLSLPTNSFADCGCGCDTCAVSSCNTCQDDCCCKPRTRTRLKLVRVCKEVCRTEKVCTTDCCGCPTTKRVRVKKRVSRLRLARVEVPPRKRCCKPAVDPCNSCNTCDPCQNDGCGCGCN